MRIYLDTSAMVKLYATESGSNHVIKLKENSSEVFTSILAYPEAISAFARKHQEGYFSMKLLHEITEKLKNDWERYVVVNIDNELIRIAGDLVMKHPLRAYDSVHLASLIRIKKLLDKNILFVCFDNNLNEVAKIENIALS